MTKQLSTSQLKEHNKKYNEVIEEDFEIDGEDYTIRIYPYFKPEKIKDLLNERQEFLNKCHEENIELQDDEISDFLGYLIIKYFTNIKTTTSRKAKTIYKDFKTLLNHEIYLPLLNVFPEKSIRKVQEMLFERTETYIKLEEEIRKQQEKIKDLPLENREVIEKVFGKEQPYNVLNDDENKPIQ